MENNQNNTQFSAINVQTIVAEANKSFYNRDFKKALSLYYSLLALNLDESTSYYNVALTYEMLSEFELAVSYYKKAIRLNPYDIRSVNNLARFYFEQMDDENCVKHYLDYAIEKCPKDAEAYNTYGLLHTKKKEFDIAIAYFKKSINLDKEFFKNYYDIALVYNELNQKENAILNIKKSLELNPNFKPAQDLLDSLNN